MLWNLFSLLYFLNNDDFRDTRIESLKLRQLKKLNTHIFIYFIKICAAHHTRHSSIDFYINLIALNSRIVSVIIFEKRMLFRVSKREVSMFRALANNIDV